MSEYSVRYTSRECPCQTPRFEKEHLRHNPTTQEPILMCTGHAKMHDDGFTFTLLAPGENR